MISKIALNIADSFVSKNIIHEEMCDVCVYGLDLIISGILNIAVIAVTGALIGKLSLAIVFMAIVIPLRMFTGGYHADTHVGCNVVCIITFLISVLLLDGIQRGALDGIVWGLTCICIVIVARFAPIENKNKKISNERKRRYKYISVLMCSIISFGSVIMNIISCSNEKYDFLRIHTLSLYINITLIIVVGTMMIGKCKEGRGICQKNL